MAAPNLNIAVEPLESGKAAYLPLAPSADGGTAQLKIVLRLRIMNNEAAEVVVTGIQFAYPRSGVPASTMQGVALVLDPDGDQKPSDANGAIQPGQTATWSNGVVKIGSNTVDNAVYLDTPAPAKVAVKVTCEGFASPATTTLELAPYTKPVADGAFLLPYGPSELRADEYVVTSARHWANGGAAGGQIFAHDISVQGIDSDGSWSQLLPGGSDVKNSDYRIWSKPVRAVADGTVESWKDGMPTNTITKGSDGKLQFPSPTPDPVAGNHFWIRHGDVLVLYAHLQKGTLPADLLQKGAPVHAGQKLGLAGNSGNATNPHTHMQCAHVGTKALRPMPFQNAWLLDQTKVTAPAGGPWTRVSARGIPFTNVAIWPESTHPRLLVPMAGIARGGSWANSFWISPDRASFEAKAQELFDQNGRRLIHVSTYPENGARRWVGIARGGDWANSFWISADRASFEAKAQQLFDQKGRRLVYVYTYPEGNARRWVGIARSGDWANSFWISPDRASFEAKAQELFDQKGRRLIHVHTYPEGNARRWVGIARSGDWASSFWISADRASFEAKAQKLFDQKGRRLIHVHTYPEGNARRWVGIARSGTWANNFWVSADLDSFSRRAQDLFDERGRRLTEVAPLVE
jgi:Peptidase family M23